MFRGGQVPRTSISRTPLAAIDFESVTVSGMGNDVLRVRAVGLRQRHVAGPGEGRHLDQLAVLEDHPRGQVRIVLHPRRLGDRRREGDRPEGPVADADALDRVQLVGRPAGQHVGDAGRHAETGHARLAALLEAVVQIPFPAHAVEIDAVHARRRNAGRGLVVHRNRACRP